MVVAVAGPAAPAREAPVVEVGGAVIAPEAEVAVQVVLCVIALAACPTALVAMTEELAPRNA